MYHNNYSQIFAISANILADAIDLVDFALYFLKM